MRYLIIVVASLIFGFLSTIALKDNYTKEWLNETDLSIIKQTIDEKCPSAENFKDSGVCIPEQPFVAVIRNADGNKVLVWGEENINKLLSSPTPQQEKK